MTNTVPTIETIQEEKGIPEAVFALLPGLQGLLEHLIGRIEGFDGKNPRTLIQSIRDDIGSFGDTITPVQSQLHQLLLSSVKTADLKAEAQRFVRQLVHTAKLEAVADPRYSLLLKLMHQADKRIPLISIIVSLRHGDPEATFPAQCYADQLLVQAEMETGEARATAALRALAATAEYLYRPYAITVWQLSYFAQGEHPGKPPDFGDLVKAAHRRLSDYPGLIEPDAGWMRMRIPAKAATHSGEVGHPLKA